MSEETNIQTGSIFYTWQVSADNGLTYSNLANAPNNSGLALSNIGADQDNYYYRVIVSSGGLSIISNRAKLSVFPEINIVTQPQNQTTSNSYATFTVATNVSAGANTSYQWEYSTYNNSKTFIPIANATGTSITVTGLGETDDGNSYRVKIVSKFSDTYPKIVYSDTALFDYITSDNITILKQPEDLYSADTSQPELFSVTASASSELQYQWEESADGISFTPIPSTNYPTLYRISVDNFMNKNQYKYRVLISSPTRSIYSNIVTLHTSIELPLIENTYNNTYLWGDPHLRIQSIKGPLSNLDDNSSNDPIVYFYIKYPNGNSYKVVYESRFFGDSTVGPTAVSRIWSEINGVKIYGDDPQLSKSTAVPSTDLTLNDCTYAGVTGWNYYFGRCLSFSTTAGPNNLNNVNYSQLLKNSIKWLCKNKANPSILILVSGNTTQYNNLINKLSSITNKNINIRALSAFDNTDNILSTTDVVLLQNDYNWWNAQELSNTAQGALKAFVAKGGGLLTSGLVIRNIALGRFKILADVVPVIPSTSYTTKAPIRYIQNINNTILNSGVSNDFIFNPFQVTGTEVSITKAKSGAIIFYHSEQCVEKIIDNAPEKTIDVGNILSVVYKSQGQWSNSPFYNVYTRWRKTIQYDGELVIGGALYWVLKSLIEYKKNPSDPKFRVWEGDILGSRADGYGIVMKPYGITREMLSDAVTASDGSVNLNKITEKITIKDNFWKNLSKLLRGLRPDDKYYIKNILYFIKHPGNRLTKPNIPVSMDAQAFSTSDASINYRWQISKNSGKTFINLNDNVLYSGVTTNSLTILKPNLLDNDNVYRLETSSVDAIKKYSNHAKLTVIPSITVSSFPTAQIASEGKATFSVAATSSDGLLKYQWQVSSTESTGYTNIVGATTNSLNLNITSYLQNNTYYRVVLSNNNSKFITNGVKLTTVPVVIINRQPLDTISFNGSASFLVDTKIINPLLTPINIVFQWQLSSNNKYYSNIVGANSNVLNLNNLTKSEDKYYYRVVITAGNTSVVSESAQLSISPTINFTNISTSVTYNKVNDIDYADIALYVGASSTAGNLTYQWQQSTDYGANYVDIPNSNVSSILVKNIPKNLHPAYKYRVLISNSVDTIISY